MRLGWGNMATTFAGGDLYNDFKKMSTDESRSKQTPQIYATAKYSVVTFFIMIR